MSDEQQDFTNPKQHKKRTKVHKLREAREREDLSKMLNDPAGRRVLWRILDQSKLLASDMFTGNSTTFYNLGKRDLGLWLYNEIMGSEPKAFMKMMEDQLQENLNG
jgi:predicted hydrocarbon binding protein